MSEFNVVDHLLERGFRTQARLAAAAGRRQSSVADWKRENRIPAECQPAILKAAKDEGLDVGPNDFFEPELRRPVG